MQEYNYADEIVKDNDNIKMKRRYVRFYSHSAEDIFNLSGKKYIFSLDKDFIGERQPNALNKSTAFKEGMKNDSINL